MEKIIKRGVILTGLQCNCKCLFCMNSETKAFFKDTNTIIKEMAYCKKEGKTHLSFFGGENSIRPDIIYLIKIAKIMGFEEIVMGTNGRMFAYKDFAKKVIDAGLSELYFSIHGHKAEIHDYLTQVPGSFKELLKGIDNIKALGFFRIGCHVTVVKQNYKFLPQISELIFKLGIRSVEFLYVNPSIGGAKRYFKKLMPRISTAAPYIKRCLDFGKKHNIQDWGISHVPMCYFKGYEQQINKPDERKTKDGIKTIESQYFVNGSRSILKKTPHISVTERVKTKKCQSCIYNSDCLGLWKEYLKQWGDKELVPVT